MAWTRAALALVVAGAVGIALLSGGSSADPRTPAALPGLPPPFLGTAVVGNGGPTAAVDAYGDIVDMRVPGPAGRALIDNPADRQAAGTVDSRAVIVPRVSIDGGPGRPLWSADSVMQSYLPGTNAVRTVARFGTTRVAIVYAADEGALACLTSAGGRGQVSFAGPGAPLARLRCDDGEARAGVAAAERSDRRWLGRGRPLGPGAPAWARAMYERSLLTLRALTDRRTGAVAAGARDGWAYVWPRDAGTAALAFAAAGYRSEARRVAHFLLGLDLDTAARFYGDGSPVPGRGPQGDAAGWVAAAARAAGRPAPGAVLPWRNRPDYQEGAPGTFLANAIAATWADGPEASAMQTTQAHRPGVAGAFETSRGLVRQAGDPGSGLDSAAAWAVRPFSLPALYPAARRTLLDLAGGQTRFGITPGEGWPGVDPWSAPTAWSAWSLAALGDRHAALRLLGDLRRAATPAGDLPERVDARSGIPRSTTPLAWPHAFAILALRQLWPDHRGRG
ncbi:MAG TPA: glycoside hydrolase family 15 protein [Solirubrobacterales bacterium]|nr:glycoside hydrolase family 15 protein [Solirubrobacterales bacterium]